ncbi:MAG: leucine-rich repeat domain-containing protein [Clostridia bacterium]|nr:leucine-rich repeat domain-containing protein [Clostridia bacterium]
MKSSLRLIITTVVLTMVLMLCAITTCACIDGSKGLEYTVNDDGKTCTITGIGKYSSKDLTIPDALGGYEVTAIADYAFKGTDIETVSGGNNVTRIGKGAFQDCKQLIKVTIPAGVTTIQEECFRGCSELRRMTLPPNLIQIGECAFQACIILKNIDIPNTTKIIGNSAFYGCLSLKSITIPDGVMRIDAGAFAGCVSLTNINFPASVRSVGEGLVCYNSLITIDVEADSPVLSSIDGNLYAEDNSVFISYACAKPDSSFDIPEGVVILSGWLFAGCHNLKTISIPKSVNSIGFEIFFKSPNIETIYYDGTVEDWKRIDKVDGWNANTESIFTIICTDGTIAMDGTVTYN